MTLIAGALLASALPLLALSTSKALAPVVPVPQWQSMKTAKSSVL
jgi:hypothetical protein